MTSDVLERLREDHRRCERLFRAIEHECARLESGKVADMPRLQAIVDYLGKYAFPRHHALEDAIFNELVKRLPNFRLDIFDLPEDHHTSRQEFINFMLAVGKEDDNLAETARSFVANERSHFISEEEIVFRYAEKCLTAEQWSVLSESLHIVESEDGRPPALEQIADLLA